VIHGGNLADQLFGDAGKDHLFGGKGDDTMDGGAGKDALDGEDGNDTAVNSGQDTFTNVENLI
jgi:Ca2+-binding RTX toxin-like protein